MNKTQFKYHFPKPNKGWLFHIISIVEILTTYKKYASRWAVRLSHEFPKKLEVVTN